MPCNIMQYHAIPCNTMQYHAIPCITMQDHSIPRNITVTNDPTSTLGPTRNPTDPEVTTEPIEHNRCQRPLQRARERREARLQKESDAHAELDPDPHVGPQRSSLSSAQECEAV